MQERSAETLIIGAGLIGSSVAMHLARLNPASASRIRVVDFDLEGTLSSSELNAGGVRATWNQPVNILSSKLSIEYFASVAQEVGYRPLGYLWLHGSEKIAGALAARERQVAAGWPVKAWDVRELQKHFPFIDKTDGIAGAIFGERDGLVNPNLLKQHYRRTARDLGVQWDDRVWVRSAEVNAQGVRVEGELWPRELSEESKKEQYTGGTVVGGPRERVTYRADRVVNCAGPWAAQLAKALGYHVPSVPVRRQVSIFDCREVDLTPYGMMVDTSGVYFHPEATNGLAGFATPAEQPGFNFQYDGESFFQELIWPALYERSTGFEKLRHMTGWAGLYETSPDESAIVGLVEGSGLGATGRVFEAHSFSGHGAMHSYAAGLALAERMTLGRYETVDLGSLSGQRFELGRELRETAVI